MEPVMPWGVKLPMVYSVPQIVPGTNRLAILRNSSTGKPFVKREPRADAFKEHLKAGTLQSVTAARSTAPFVDVRFPLDGAQCQIRVDVLFAFSRSGNGPGRMKTADLDNLKKMVFDALVGTLIDDDRWITEGYAAKGSGSDADTNDRICLIVSRAGYRDAAQLDWLALNLPILPPWRPENQGKILLAPAGVLKKIN
jgi:hypothetical protein